MKPLHNPYLDAFNECQDDQNSHRPGWSSRIFKRRTELTRMYAWAIPNDEVIYAIAALSPIIELGAGSGYWASLLRQAGAKVRAFDAPSTDPEAKFYTFDARHNPISPSGPHITARYPDHTLLLCWPPMDTQYDLIALDEHRRAKGKNVVYIGEGDEGCTGSKAFHRLLNHAYELTQCIYIPQWYGMHDAAYFYTRKGN